MIEFAPSLFVGDGPTVSFFGFPYPTRMAVVRLGDGGLWVWSPVELTPELEREVEALGVVRHLVAPNKLHHLFLQQWKDRWPESRLYGPAGLIARKKADLRFDAELVDVPDPAWAEEIDQVVFRGSPLMEEVAFLHRSSRTALVCDLVQRIDPKSLSGWKAVVMRLDNVVGENGGTPRDWRSTFLQRGSARIARAKMLSWKPQHLVLAHGTCVHDGALPVLEKALGWMGKP